MAKVGYEAPNLRISDWVQGGPTNIDRERGKVVVVQVFQVNCPGALHYGMDNAIKVYKKFNRDEVTVLGLATAFEHHHLNNLENLKALLYDGTVVGDTKEYFQEHGMLENGRMKKKIPFPIARDSLIEPPAESIYSRFEEYRGKKTFPETFNEYEMDGTPTILVIDKRGTLRHKIFGAYDPTKDVKKLIKEK